MWRNFTCGDILDVEKFVWFHELLALAYQVKLFDNIILMWDLFSMAFTLFSCKICYAAIYAVLSRNLFCRSLRTFCVETTYGQNVVLGEKMTNIMYGPLLWQFSISNPKTRIMSQSLTCKVTQYFIIGLHDKKTKWYLINCSKSTFTM